MSKLFNKKINIISLFFFFGAIIFSVIDQIIKLIVVNNMSLNDTIPIIDSVLHITYVLNDGAAFSSMSGQSWLLCGVTSVMIIVLTIYLLFGKIKHVTGQISLSLIVSGGIGNLIDRFFRGEVLFKGLVVDYIDFRLINFPVFNFADCCVVIGTAILVIYVLFYDKEISVEDKNNV